MNLLAYSLLGFVLFFTILTIYLSVQKKKPDFKGLLFFRIPVLILFWGSIVLFIGGLFSPSTTQATHDVPAPTLTKEQQEYFRISANIRAGKYDHVPDFTPSHTKLTNRFILLRLYYEKTGDTKKEKQLILDYMKNKKLYNDDDHLPIRMIIQKRLAALEKE